MEETLCVSEKTMTTLVSNDNHCVTLPVSCLKLSSTLHNLVTSLWCEDSHANAEIRLPIPNVAGKELILVKKYLEHYESLPIPNYEAEFNESHDAEEEEDEDEAVNEDFHSRVENEERKRTSDQDDESLFVAKRRRCHVEGVASPTLSNSSSQKPVRYPVYDNKLQPWDETFIPNDAKAVVRLANAADFLDIDPLIAACCVRIASFINGKTPDEIRARFGIEKDFSTEELEQIRKEQKWIEENLSGH